MIPSIEDIIAGMESGTYSREQALVWLHQHASPSLDREDRAMFAAMALPTAFKVYEAGYTGEPRGEETMPILVAKVAIEMADALLAALGEESNVLHPEGK